MTYAARLNSKINGAARVQLISLELQAQDAADMLQARMDTIRAKASAYITKHPAPRAVFH